MEFDITNERQVKQTVGELKEQGVRTIINATGAVNIDEIECQRYATDPTTLSAYRINAAGAEYLARACADASELGTEILLLHLSTESVFGDSVDRTKYREDAELAIPKDATGMIQYADTETMPTMYGLTSAIGDQKVLETYRSGSVIVRMHGVQGPQHCFFARTVGELKKKEPFTRVNDMYVAHLADATIAKAIFTIEESMHDPRRRTRGIYHLSARDALTPYAITLRFAEVLNASRCLVTPIGLAELIETSERAGESMARRPHYTVLDVGKFEQDFYELPTMRDEITNYITLYGDLFLTVQR
jgi:dTDP-4-dehydrorhamnose reductase